MDRTSHSYPREPSSNPPGNQGFFQDSWVHSAAVAAPETPAADVPQIRPEVSSGLLGTAPPHQCKKEVITCQDSCRTCLIRLQPVHEGPWIGCRPSQCMLYGHWLRIRCSLKIIMIILRPGSWCCRAAAFINLILSSHLSQEVLLDFVRERSHERGDLQERSCIKRPTLS